MNDYRVRYVSLPLRVEAVTLPCDDGSFDIYINADLPLEKQYEAYLHELRHIELDHFYSWASVTTLEQAANKKIP